MIAFTHLQRFAEPPGPFLRHQPRSPAAGGKRDSAQPWTTSTVGMIDAGEGTSDSHPRHHCTGPFAHGDIAHRAQLSRGLGSQRVGVSSPIPSTTRVRIPLEQHKSYPENKCAHYLSDRTSDVYASVCRLFRIGIFIR